MQPSSMAGWFNMASRRLICLSALLAVLATAAAARESAHSIPIRCASTLPSAFDHIFAEAGQDERGVAAV